MSGQAHTFSTSPPAWAAVVFTDNQVYRLTFTKLWQRAVAASDLTRTEKLVAHTLAMYFSGGEGDSANPSLDRLGREASLHRSNVVRSLDELERRGFIARSRSRGRVRTSYRLTVAKDLWTDPNCRIVQQSQGATVGGDGAAQLSHSARQLSQDAPQLSQNEAPTVAPARHQGVRRVLEGVPRGSADADRGALWALKPETPYEAGKLLAELCNSGETIHEPEFVAFFDSRFDDGIEDAWRAYRQHRERAS